MSELAEGARLEIVCAVKSGTEGSNPSLSAILPRGSAFKGSTFRGFAFGLWLFATGGWPANRSQWQATRQRRA
jgi:hypothetical protein